MRLTVDLLNGTKLMLQVEPSETITTFKSRIPGFAEGHRLIRGNKGLTDGKVEDYPIVTDGSTLRHDKARKKSHRKPNPAGVHSRASTKRKAQEEKALAEEEPTGGKRRRSALNKLAAKANGVEETAPQYLEEEYSAPLTSSARPCVSPYPPTRQPSERSAVSQKPKPSRASTPGNIGSSEAAVESAPAESAPTEPAAARLFEDEAQWEALAVELVAAEPPDPAPTKPAPAEEFFTV